MTVFSTATEIPRDYWGRPLIKPVGGGKPVAYTRCTTYVNALEDTYNLGLWQMRMTALGLAARPDLVLSTVAHCDSKDKLNEICQQAIEAAKAGASAVVGTALHALTDQQDRGRLDLATVPEAYRGDLEAFRKTTEHLVVRGIERFVVNDELKVAGTFDREYGYLNTNWLGDTKTGNITYGVGKIAMQLAMYSRSMLYDPDTGERTPLEVDQDRAIVVHLPAGTGTCELHWVDISAGWEAIALATSVRKWRARKGLTNPFLAEAPTGSDPLMVAINNATDPFTLRKLWADNWTGGWTSEHTAAAKARKEHLMTIPLH